MNTSAYYYCFETEHIFATVQVNTGSLVRDNASFRARLCLKSGDKKYEMDYGIFHRFDYPSLDNAFETAKKWLSEQIDNLLAECQQLKEASDNG